MSDKQDGVEGADAQDTVEGAEVTAPVETVTGEDTLIVSDTIEVQDEQVTDTAPAGDESVEEPAAAEQEVATPAEVTVDSAAPIPPTAMKQEEPATQAATQEETETAEEELPLIPEQQDIPVEIHHAELMLLKKYPNYKTKPAVQNIIKRLDEYEANMRPNQPISPVDGARQQLNLYRTITSALEVSGVEGVMVMDVIVHYFRTFKAEAFNESYVMRFMEYVTLDKKQKLLAQMILVIFTTFVKENGHARIKREVNFSQIQKYMTSTIGFEKLLTYFSK